MRLKVEVVQHPVKLIAGTEYNPAVGDAVAADFICSSMALAANADAKTAKIAHTDDVTVGHFAGHHVEQRIEHTSDIGPAYRRYLFDALNELVDVCFSRAFGRGIKFCFAATGNAGFSSFDDVI